MSRPIEPYLRWFDDYQALEHQLIDVVSDSDLAHLIAGSPTLGELCWEHGEVERAYLDSFRTYKLRFDYGHPDAHLAGSTEALSDWYTRLDQEFEAVLASFVDDPETTIIDRGTWSVSVRENLAIYKEAVVIFAAKAWVHLLAMGKALPQQWKDWL